MASTATAGAAHTAKPQESLLQRILKRPITATLIAIALGFAVAAVLLAVAGYDPVASFAALFEGVFSKPKYISNTIIKASPIILTGISVAFAFKTGMFNIGAEGQYVAGAVCAVLVGSTLDLPMVLQVPVVILAGIAGGAAIGAITGFLKARFGIHEVITAIMLNWTMLYLNNFVVNSEMFHRPSSTSSIPVNPSSYTMILPEWKLSDQGLETLRTCRGSTTSSSRPTSISPSSWPSSSPSRSGSSSTVPSSALSCAPWASTATPPSSPACPSSATPCSPWSSRAVSRAWPAPS